MTKIFEGQNNLSSRTAFEQRKAYKQAISDPEIDFIDTWYENPRYGLLNSNYDPVVFLPGDSRENLQNFGDYAPEEAIAAPFIVKAFNDFREVYTQLADTSALPYPPFLENLIPTKGYVDFESEYFRYGLRQMEEFIDFLDENKNRVTTFEQFMELFKVYFYENASNFKITKTGFLLSNHCPINVSGLCVELSSLPYENDSFKGEMIQTQEFRCYSDATKEVGFYIDKNAPWRLIANLESPQMQNYIKSYEPNTTVDNILDRSFRIKTHYDDLDAIISICKSTYESFARQNPFYSHSNLKRSNLLREQEAQISPIEYWISFLLMARMLENGMNMSSYEKFNKQVLDTHEAYSVKYIERPLKPALAKIGSYTSNLLRQIYSNRDIDSTKPVKLGRYIDSTDTRY